MQLIISPAKKMRVSDDRFAHRGLPFFVDRSEVLLRAIAQLDYEQLKDLWRCSDALVKLNAERFASMDLRAEPLSPAVLAYEGIAFQHLAAQVMTDEQLCYLEEHLFIVSGLYGLLRPCDGVVSYRLEMQAKLAVGTTKSLYEFWGEDLTSFLAQHTDVVINLASQEYAKAALCGVGKAGQEDVDIRVITCLFGTIDAQGRFVQRSTAAKAARGSMVHWCAQNKIQHPDDLAAFNELGYAVSSDYSTDDCMVFIK